MAGSGGAGALLIVQLRKIGDGRAQRATISAARRRPGPAPATPSAARARYVASGSAHQRVEHAPDVKTVREHRFDICRRAGPEGCSYLHRCAGLTGLTERDGVTAPLLAQALARGP